MLLDLRSLYEAAVVTPPPPSGVPRMPLAIPGTVVVATMRPAPIAVALTTPRVQSAAGSMAVTRIGSTATQVSSPLAVPTSHADSNFRPSAFAVPASAASASPKVVGTSVRVAG